MNKTHTPILTVLPIAVYVDAFIWIIGVIPTLLYAFTYQTLPRFGGIRLMGGPFERLGLDSLIVAGILYVIVSALKILAAYWLQNSRMDGAILELVLLGLSTIFWVGFALPLGPLVGISQIILLALAWRTLH